MPLPWEQDYGGGAPAAAAPAGMPWERDYGEKAAKPAEDKGTFLHPKRPTSEGWQYTRERLMQYPGLVAGAIADALEAGPKLMGDVVEGRVPATSPEAITRSLDAASFATPVTPARLTGAQIARRTAMADADRAAIAGGAPGGAPMFNPAHVDPDIVPPPASAEAAQISKDLGAPLPSGLVSGSPAVQAATQAARQLPFVGQQIDERVAGTIRAAGEKVGGVAEDLSGGPVPGRAVTGANTRSSLQSVIDRNNDQIENVYNDLRANYIEGHKFANLKSTKATRDAILKERRGAGMSNPNAGLADINELLSSGRSFNALVRARAEVGKIIGLAKNNPNPGFNVGDFKRLYGSLTSDMENAVRANGRIGVHPDQAAAAFRNANSAAQQIIDRNASIQRILNIKSDEQMVGHIINAAKDRTGNARVLWELRNQMPVKDFEEIAGLGLSELGHNPTTNTFSLAKFARGWNDMGDFAKSTLIRDQSHRKALDDIAKLGSFLKDADKYANTSGTGRATALAGLLGAGGGAVMSLEPAKILAVLGGAGAGLTLARVLARPTTASSLRRWLSAYARMERQTAARTFSSPGSPRHAAAATLAVATKNLITNLRDMPEAETPPSRALPASPRKDQTRATSVPSLPPPGRSSSLPRPRPRDRESSR